MPEKLDSQARRLLERNADMTILPSHVLSPESARKTLNDLLITDESGESVGEVTDWKIAGPSGGVPVRVYRPGGEGPFPIIVYFHGGGWVKGNIETHDDLCRQLTNETEAIVVSVDYRRPPESPFPAALEDCYAATTWAAKHAEHLDGDSEQVAVGGESAGGNLAAAVSLLARDRDGPTVRHQLLLYPVLDRDFSRDSYREVGDVGLLTEANMRWYWEQYLERDIDSMNPYAAPLQARDLSNLPAATVVTCGWDPLHDEGVDYAERLAEAGSSVTLIDEPDQLHGFLSCPDVIDRADEVWAEIASDVRDTFRQ
ncbi:alpha/beta hydrolase [Halorarum salinum]|uniref:Alpha/beta hydrolase n=1 Tax=Halorarum salinum TaxID=2743089 RepID=A0A7D5L914_9EURY|nr:alpha/beta hydrolase [Halobaculum salinum]QLG61053.1 alpha/beta hydrolase [Halobaculum salinum]